MNPVPVAPTLTRNNISLEIVLRDDGSAPLDAKVLGPIR